MMWNEFQEAELKKLWEEGLTASQIAETMGQGLSRNAVIGKKHRMNLSMKDVRKPARQARFLRSPDAKPPRPTPTRTYPSPPIKAERMQAFEQTELGDMRKLTIMQLASGDCRWPLGDPGARDFRYCGNVIGYRSYCSHHAALAYQPARPSANIKPHPRDAASPGAMQ